MSGELTLENWVSALEGYSDVVETITNIGLVSDPKEELSKPAQELIQGAIDAISNKAGMESKAIVIAAESFSPEGIKKFFREVSQRLIQFIRRLLDFIGQIFKKIDDKIGDAIDTVGSWSDEVWRKIDDFLGKQSKEDRNSSFIDLAFSVGPEPIKIYSELVAAVRHYTDDTVPFLFKLLDRDAQMINELLVATAYFGKLNLSQGNSTVINAVKEAEGKIQKSQFEANKNTLGGLTLTEVTRPDNLGVLDNPVFDALQQIKAVTYVSHHAEKHEFDEPTKEQLKDIAKYAEKLKKFFKNKKDKFASYSEDILKEAEGLQNALKSLEGVDQDEQGVASLMLGQRTVATVMWLVALYTKEGSAIMRSYHDVIGELTRFLDALIKVSEKVKSEQDN